MDLATARAAVADIRSMQLRNGSVVGGSTGSLSTSGTALFEEGVALVFERWTALCLAIEQEWGGAESSLKAEDLYAEVLHWFNKNADDLEMLLLDQMLADFNAQVEDGSAREVAKKLVALHDDLMHQQTGLLQALRAAVPSGASSSRRQQVDLDGTPISNDAEESSESGSSTGDDEMAEAPTTATSQPIIDDEGFQLVQSRSKSKPHQRH